MKISPMPEAAQYNQFDCSLYPEEGVYYEPGTHMMYINKGGFVLSWSMPQEFTELLVEDQGNDEDSGVLQALIRTLEIKGIVEREEILQNMA